MKFLRLGIFGAVLVVLGCGGDGDGLDACMDSEVHAGVPCTTQGEWSCNSCKDAAYRCDGTMLVNAGPCDDCTVGWMSRSVACGPPSSNGDLLFGHMRTYFTVAGDPCTGEGGEICAFDRTSKLTCRSGTYQPAEVCTGSTVCKLQTQNVMTSVGVWHSVDVLGCF